MPCSAAQCIAVMPSPCAALTSAPPASRARTAAMSPSIAASATGESATRGAAAPKTRISAAQPRRPPGQARLPCCHGRHPCVAAAGPRDEGEFSRAVAEALHLHPQTVESPQHGVGHGRGVGRLDVQVPFQQPVGSAHQDQRAAAMVVQVGVGHRRAPHDHGLVQKAGVTLHAALQLLEEVRQLAHAVLADLVELEDRFLARAVVRRGVEGAVGAALGEDAVVGVAAGLEGDDPRHVGLEGEHLQVEHEAHVLGERVRNACGCLRQLALLAAGGCATPTAAIRRSISRTLFR